MSRALKRLTGKLSRSERRELRWREKAIAGAMHGIRKLECGMGKLLLEICDKRLYREKFQTFEQYCREVWGLTRAAVYARIKAGEQRARLSKIFDKSEVEKLSDSAVRELGKIPEDQLDNVIDVAAEEVKPTAKRIGQVRKIKKRIAELEKKLSGLKRGGLNHDKLRDDWTAEIAALEAQLRGEPAAALLMLPQPKGPVREPEPMPDQTAVAVVEPVRQQAVPSQSARNGEPEPEEDEVDSMDMATFEVLTGHLDECAEAIAKRSHWGEPDRMFIEAYHQDLLAEFEQRFVIKEQNEAEIQDYEA